MSLQVIKSSARKSTQLITDSHPGTSMIPVNPVSAVPAATTEVLDYDSLALEEVPVPVGQAVPFRSDDSAIGGVRGLPSLVQRAWPVSFPVDSRTEGVLSGLEAPAPQSAIGLVADELDISYSVAIGEMANLMRVALYLADGTIADLENATAPEAIEALAATAIARHGLTAIVRRHGRDNEAIFFGNDLVRKEVLFPDQVREQAAADAAARWQWKRLL